MRRVEVGESPVVSQLNGGFGGIEHDRVQIGKLEVVGRRPISDLVCRRHCTDTPVPGLAIVKVGLQGERRVGDIETGVVPRGVGEAVDRREIALCIELDNVASKGH